MRTGVDGCTIVWHYLQSTHSRAEYSVKLRGFFEINSAPQRVRGTFISFRINYVRLITIKLSRYPNSKEKNMLPPNRNNIVLLTVICLAIDIYANPYQSDYFISFTSFSWITPFCYNILPLFPNFLIYYIVTVVNLYYFYRVFIFMIY